MRNLGNFEIQCLLLLPFIAMIRQIFRVEKIRNSNIEIRNKFYMTGSSPLPTDRQARTMKIIQDYPPPSGGIEVGVDIACPPHTCPLPPGERG